MLTHCSLVVSRASKAACRTGRVMSRTQAAGKMTIEVLHVLKPIGVCMAGADEFDPYKD